MSSLHLSDNRSSQRVCSRSSVSSCTEIVIHLSGVRDRRLLVRRGTALSEIGNAAAAVADFEAALRLRPDDGRLQVRVRSGRRCAGPRLIDISLVSKCKLLSCWCIYSQFTAVIRPSLTRAPCPRTPSTPQADLDELRSCSAPLAPEGVRRRGDARFKAGDLQGALAAYDSVLRMAACPPAERVAALANRAAASMAAGDFGAAIDDSTQGIKELLLTAGSAARDAPEGPPEAARAPAVPHAEPEDAEGWLALNLSVGGAERAALCRLLARRGAARGHMRLFSAGARDLLSAAGLLRDEGAADRAASLEEDAERLRALSLAPEDDGAGTAAAPSDRSGGQGAPPASSSGGSDSSDVGGNGGESGGDVHEGRNPVGPGGKDATTHADAGGKSTDERGSAAGSSGEEGAPRGEGVDQCKPSSPGDQSAAGEAFSAAALKTSKPAALAAFRDVSAAAPPLSPQRAVPVV